MASVLYFYFLSVFGWPVLFNFFFFFFFFFSLTRIYMLNSAIIYHHSLYLHQKFYYVYVCTKTQVPGCLYLKSMTMIRLDAILCDLCMWFRGEFFFYKVHVGLGRREGPGHTAITSLVSKKKKIARAASSALQLVFGFGRMQVMCDYMFCWLGRAWYQPYLLISLCYQQGGVFRFVLSGE